MKSSSSVLLAMAAAACLTASALAGPSHRDIDAAMDVHNQAHYQVETKELLANTQKLYENCFEAVGQLVGGASRGAGDRLPPKLVSSTRVGLEVLSRQATELQLHGETAGIDYMLRILPLEPPFGKAVEQFNASANGMAQAQRARMALQSTAAARNVALQKAQQLAQQGKLQEAFDAINKLWDETIALTVFLPLPEQQRIHDTMASQRAEIIANRNNLARADIIAKLETVSMAQAPNDKALLAELQSAADGLRTNAMVELGGQQRTGPQAVSYFLDEWRKNQMLALRHRGIMWAQRVKIGRTGASQAPPEDESFELAYQEFCGKMSTGLVSLIEAEAARAAAAEAPTLYRQHLDTLAPALSRIDDPTLADRATAALDQLAAKDANLAAEVQAYHQATDEFLRWRERAYGAVAAAYEKASPAFEALVVEQGKSGEGFSGMFEFKDPVAREARLIGSAPEILNVLTKRVLEQPTWIRNLSGLPNKKFCLARLHDRTFATAAWPDVTTAIGDMKLQLSVTEQLPPLTLAATAAVQSADIGDFAAVGGTIKGLYLDGLVSRFAALPDNYSLLLPLGPMPRELPAAQLLNHLMIRSDLQPMWVHHRYFFVDLSAPAAPAN